jgi:peptidyl-prolyl cis-trans isomerase C
MTTPMPPMGTVVARVGNFYVTKDDLDKEVESFNALVAAQGRPQEKIDTRDKKINYLKNDVVRKYILYAEALGRGLDRKADIQKAIETYKISLLVTELLRQEIEKIDVSSKEIEDFYNQNKEALKEPEQRKVLEIMTPTEEEAKQIYIELLKGADFATLAKQNSKAATASKGGDLGYLAYEWQPEKQIRFNKFYEMAFSPSLEKGAVSSIFKGPDGYYIVKVEDIKQSAPKSLSELWENIKSWLLFEKQQKSIKDLADKLAGQTKVEIYEGKVD